MLTRTSRNHAYETVRPMSVRGTAHPNDLVLLAAGLVDRVQQQLCGFRPDAIFGFPEGKR